MAHAFFKTRPEGRIFFGNAEFKWRKFGGRPMDFRFSNGIFDSKQRRRAPNLRIFRRENAPVPRKAVKDFFFDPRGSPGAAGRRLRPVAPGGKLFHDSSPSAAEKASRRLFAAPAIYARGFFQQKNHNREPQRDFLLYDPGAVASVAISSRTSPLLGFPTRSPAFFGASVFFLRPAPLQPFREKPAFRTAIGLATPTTAA